MGKDGTGQAQEAPVDLGHQHSHQQHVVEEWGTAPWEASLELCIPREQGSVVWGQPGPFGATHSEAGRRGHSTQLSSGHEGWCRREEWGGLWGGLASTAGP